MMVRLIALNERAERGYGKEFEAHPTLARTLKAIKWADDAPVRAGSLVSEMETLRGEYAKATGSTADKRWGAARLRNALGAYKRRDMRADEHSDQYQRRDMTAED